MVAPILLAIPVVGLIGMAIFGALGTPSSNANAVDYVRTIPDQVLPQSSSNPIMEPTPTVTTVPRTDMLGNGLTFVGGLFDTIATDPIIWVLIILVVFQIYSVFFDKPKPRKRWRYA